MLVFPYKRTFKINNIEKIVLKKKEKKKTKGK